MTDKRIAKQHHATFEGIRQLDADGNEYWSARKLAKVLDYSEYRHFLPVIERAKAAGVTRVLAIGSGTGPGRLDCAIKLSEAFEGLDA